MCPSAIVAMYYDVITTIGYSIKMELWPQWELFRNDNGSFEQSELQIEVSPDIQSKYGIDILNDQPGMAVFRCADCILSTNSDWTKAKLNLLNEIRGKTLAIYRVLNALLFTHLSTRQAIQIHASLVQIKNTGLMFLGPSGIGKTTQAELWMKFREAEIINGDMVFVKQESDHFLGCGSPWHGSSPYCLNRQVPLSALIVLKQSQQNSIRRLTGFEMVSTVLNSVFLPSWYQAGYKAALNTVDILLRTVPVYELSCRPDEDTVRLTEEIVFGKSSILL